MNEQVRGVLDSQDWASLIIKVTAYAIHICSHNKIKWLEPEDVVMDAIDKIYKGERKWDPHIDPDLNRYIKSVVKSILSNEFNSAKNKNRSNDDYGECIFFSVDDYTEQEMYCKELDKNILFSMRGDPELCLVYKALKDGYKPSEISEEYGLEILNVRNIQKRLHRVVLKVIYTLSKVNLDGRE